ncbi:archaetidylserine decarboxylase [Pleionea sp. CnH1-48]|uniref:archaetidylserine decarboxylase n=1 Tax=Pleionea sp. CnH1-48 TaxID=2954494 RepID=UPI002096B420|nr:archaetidylserine decarboxylase [Pleionea sp. CnH1-48]MCO7227426.1 archaetidylserine decarboxylase [Pleionea sp. CnH1-48]
MSFIDHLKTLPQYLIPQHGLSQLAGKLADSKTFPFRHNVIKAFAKHYGIDMSLAQEPNLEAYDSFNDFFTRAIRPEVRPICDEPNTMACPVDGAVSQFGPIKEGRIFQAKGHDYSATELLGGDQALGNLYKNGQFCTIYLSPKDYHRIHMPVRGSLTQMIHVPGKLFSVNPLTARTVPHLFARNERVVAMFDTEFGPIAMVSVGATIVGSVETVWSGIVTPPTKREVVTTHYGEDEIVLEKGDEMGRFRLGSTIVLLLPEGDFEWDESIVEEAPTILGQPLVKKR